MLEHLLQFDRHLFHFINHDLGNPFFDWLMPTLRNARSWIPLYLVLVVFFLWRYGKNGILIIVLMACSAGFADYTSVHLGKYEVKRLRPCRDPIVSQTVISRVPCGPGYSFPSTHATDHFAMVGFLIFVFFRKWRWIILWTVLWAGSICFAQVYVGVHFPVDVIIGALYGLFVGWLFASLFKKLQPKF